MSLNEIISNVAGFQEAWKCNNTFKPTGGALCLSNSKLFTTHQPAVGSVFAPGQKDLTRHRSGLFF